MRSTTLLAGLAATASLSSAHTIFTTLFVNDVNQGDGTCVRMDTDGNRCTGPIKNINDSPDMACGREGQKAVAFTCPASAGDKLTFEFREWADYAQPGVLDARHQGPVAVYVKQVDNMASDSAAGDGWFKIWDEGYDSSTGQWASDKLIASNGLLSVKVPSGLPTGYYLYRTEVLTFQNVTNGYVDPQFYVGCAQMFIQGSSDGPLVIPADRKVSIPGHVKLGDKSIHFNIYDQPLKLPYDTPGPKPFIPAAGGGSVGQKKVAQTQGAVPNTCLVKNANWCGVEVPSYTTETGCWAALKNCYDQLDVCYKTFPPSGARGCDKWDTDKCKVIDAGCQSGKFTGPPNKGVKLGDATGTPSVPVPVPAQPNPEPEPVESNPAEPSVSAAPEPEEDPTYGGGDGEDNGEPSASATVTEAPVEASAAPVPSEVYVELPSVPTNSAVVAPVSLESGLPSTFSTVVAPKPTATKGCGGKGGRPELNYGYKRKSKKVKKPE
ncbi:Glycosyl hydrolase family 61 domain containing protein [Rhypophila decipiens]